MGKFSCVLLHLSYLIAIRFPPQEKTIWRSKARIYSLQAAQVDWEEVMLKRFVKVGRRRFAEQALIVMI